MSCKVENHKSRPGQSIKIDIGKPIDKSISIDNLILIDIDFIGQSIRIDITTALTIIISILSINIDFID